ncbi:hypothetical protein [Methylorubrum extorquens]
MLALLRFTGRHTGGFQGKAATGTTVDM